MTAPAAMANTTEWITDMTIYKLSIYRNNPRGSFFRKGFAKHRIRNITLIWAGPVFLTWNHH